MPDPTDDPEALRYYHGTRAELGHGALIEPDGDGPDAVGWDGLMPHVRLSPHLDEAIWDAEIAAGDGPARVYTVEPTGPIGRIADVTGGKPPAHPSMSWCSRAPLRVTGEVTEWRYYHGTRADLKAGDLIAPGRAPNFGDKLRSTKHVYLTRTLDAATWGAELALGDGRARIYVVEPTGIIEEDPNLTNRKFRGNPTKSFRSCEPLRVTGEVTDWQAHAPEALEAMKAGLARLEQQGVGPFDD